MTGFHRRSRRRGRSSPRWFRQEILALYFAVQDKRTPLRVKILVKMYAHAYPPDARRSVVRGFAKTVGSYIIVNVRAYYCRYTNLLLRSLTILSVCA
jgi:hypothetical protein